MYVGHLLVARRELVSEAGGFDSEFDMIQDFELLLRLSERTERIHHIPETLYHWRAIPGSIALGHAEKENVSELQARAVNAHLRRRGIAAEADSRTRRSHTGCASARPPRPPSRASASWSRAGRADRALRALRDRTSYPSLETIAEEAVGWFRPAALANAGAARAAGEFLVFLESDVEVTDPDWIEQLLIYAEMPGVGAVGPTLARPGRAGRGGRLAPIGLHDPAAPRHARLPAPRRDGYYGSLSCAREVSAVGMDCMLIRARLFEGSAASRRRYSRQFSGSRPLPAARGSSASRSSARRPREPSATRPRRSRRADFDVIDRALFVDRWYEPLEEGDPFYNRRFFRAAADYALPPFNVDPQELAMREAVG